MSRPLALAVAVAAALAPLTVAHARPDTSQSEMYHYAAGDTVEHFDSAGGHFRIFFTRAGVNAVPAVDADTNGIPDDVDEVAALYEQVLALYTTTLGYHAPRSDQGQSDNGGDGRFDVYMLDFAGNADGAFRRENCDATGVCSGFMVQENDFAGYAYPSRSYGNRVLASHEFFHAVQAAYDDGENTIFSEGTAVWATERFDPSLSDLESFAPGFFTRPDHSLYLPGTGPVDAFSYASGVFFLYLSERFGDPVIRELWEGAVGPMGWFDIIDGVLQRHQSSFADAFTIFARWNLYTQHRADPTRGYSRGAGLPLLTMQPGTAPLTVTALRLFPSATTYYNVPPAGRARIEAALVVPAGVDGAPLRIGIATRTGNVVGDVAWAATLDDSAGVDSTGADECIILAVNTAQSGESIKPTLCVGSPDEVAACRTAATPPIVEPSMPPMAHGCSVSAGASAGASGGSSAACFALLLLALLVSRRGRILA